MHRVNILGVGVNTIDLPTASDFLVNTSKDKRSGYVCVTSVHGIIESQKDTELMNIHNRSLLTVPDGMPTVWFGLGSGFTNIGRVYGPDLMKTVLSKTADSEATHFLYGGGPGIAEQLKTKIEKSYPGVNIVGMHTPPFEPLSQKEKDDLIATVQRLNPDFFWVGLSTPKQEKFMAAYSDKLNTRVMIGVGAAFDIISGVKKDAPDWIKRSGFQWLFRLCQEPRRLGKRYLYIVPAFIILIILQTLGFKKQESFRA
ncbi:hypothetical protein BVX97_05955 [bacterium E08(2017)]|nr:hypothetical protein BVX97_05955 [bacterium E08(2017)]